MAKRKWPKLGSWKAAALCGAAALTLVSSLTLYMYGPGTVGRYLASLWTRSYSTVLDLARSQPEVLSSVENYVKLRVSARRIATGQEKAAEWKDTIAAIEKQYGVPARTLVSIWGIESNFGRNMGDHNVLGSLAALADGGYRSDYFRAELSAAEEMIRDGHAKKSQMTGSWAGAIGQTQFMPSNYLTYAVDQDGDGRKDLWNSVPDSLASTANFLKEKGWRRGADWGYEVKLPAAFDFGKVWKKNASMTLRDWGKLGITRVTGKPLPQTSETARFYQPAGGNGPVFLVLKNFEVIKRYNNADSYALAVAHLADRIAGGQDFVQAWPADMMPLSREERRELEELMAAKGYDPSKADGILSPAGRLAIIKFQRKEGLLADGHPSRALLQRLRSASQVSAGKTSKAGS
ncbi:MAG: lytic murein transglycosylase [Pseudomonadota bacterium]